MERPDPLKNRTHPEEFQLTINDFKSEVNGHDTHNSEDFAAPAVLPPSQTPPSEAAQSEQVLNHASRQDKSGRTMTDTSDAPSEVSMTDAKPLDSEQSLLETVMSTDNLIQPSSSVGEITEPCSSEKQLDSGQQDLQVSSGVEVSVSSDLPATASLPSRSSDAPVMPETSMRSFATPVTMTGESAMSLQTGTTLSHGLTTPAGSATEENAESMAPIESDALTFASVREPTEAPNTTRSAGPNEVKPKANESHEDEDVADPAPIEIDNTGMMCSDGNEVAPSESSPDLSKHVSDHMSDTQAAPDSGERRQKRFRSKPSASPSNKKKSRSNSSSALKRQKLLDSDWEVCLQDFYEESAWSGASKRWAELKSKTIERGEAWMKQPINLPTRYLAEFLQLMYSLVPQLAPAWKVLPSSLTNTAAGTERRAQTHKCNHRVPFATPVTVNCRNETHVHYLLPLTVVAQTALKLVQNSLAVARIVPPILRSAFLDVITQCPTLSTHLLLLGVETITISTLINLVCLKSWPKLESEMGRHVVDAPSRPARRKVQRTSADMKLEEISEADTKSISDAVDSCLSEIAELTENIRTALLPSAEKTRNICRADKSYQAGDVVLRNVPCQMLLTYSAVLRLEVYKILGIPQAMLEFDFDDLMQASDSSDKTDTDKSLIARAEKLNCGSSWKELRKEHYKMLDQRIQIFLDFTLDRTQADWLMSSPDEHQNAPSPLSKASHIIANAALTSDGESGSDANLSIDLNIDGVLKLASADKTSPASVDFGQQCDSLVNFVATRTIKGSDNLRLSLGSEWRAIDATYFSED